MARVVSASVTVERARLGMWVFRVATGAMNVVDYRATRRGALRAARRELGLTHQQWERAVASGRVALYVVQGFSSREPK